MHPSGVLDDGTPRNLTAILERFDALDDSTAMIGEQKTVPDRVAIQLVNQRLKSLRDAILKEVELLKTIAADNKTALVGLQHEQEKMNGIRSDLEGKVAQVTKAQEAKASELKDWGKKLDQKENDQAAEDARLKKREKDLSLDSTKLSLDRTSLRTWKANLLAARDALEKHEKALVGERQQVAADTERVREERQQVTADIGRVREERQQVTADMDKVREARAALDSAHASFTETAKYLGITVNEETIERLGNGLRDINETTSLLKTIAISFQKHLKEPRKEGVSGAAVSSDSSSRRGTDTVQRKRDSAVALTPQMSVAKKRRSVSDFRTPTRSALTDADDTTGSMENFDGHRMNRPPPPPLFESIENSMRRSVTSRDDPFGGGSPSRTNANRGRPKPAMQSSSSGVSEPFNPRPLSTRSFAIPQQSAVSLEKQVIDISDGDESENDEPSREGDAEAKTEENEARGHSIGKKAGADDQEEEVEEEDGEEDNDLEDDVKQLLKCITRPPEWSRRDEESFIKLIKYTEGKRLEKGHHSKDYEFPEHILDSIASEPSNLGKFEKQEFSCWLTKFGKTGRSRWRGGPIIPAEGCRACKAVNLPCVYFKYVPGIITEKWVWKGNCVEVDSENVTENVNELEPVDLVQGKRWQLELRR